MCIFLYEGLVETKKSHDCLIIMGFLLLRDGLLLAFQHSSDRPPDWTAVIYPKECDEAANTQDKPVVCGYSDDYK